MRLLQLSFLTLSLTLFALSLSACDCGGGNSMLACGDSSECPIEQICVDGFCTDPMPGHDSGVNDGGGGLCTDGRDRCGSACCREGEVCEGGFCRLDCGAGERCGATCCGAGQMCLDSACVAQCADPANLCGASLELCCDPASEACLGDACRTLGAPCTLTEECEVDEICLASLGRCAPRDGVEVCEFRPPVGEFSPTTACQWRPGPGDPFPSFDDVVQTPSVANLSDDNGDGRTDTLDIPDIVFVSFDRQANGCCTANGRIRVVSGACNLDGTMTTLATIDTPFIDNSSGVALGNLHPDTMDAEHPPEIVATFRGGGTAAFRRTRDDGTAWELFWRNDAYLPAARSQGGAQPSIADLDGDGAPEVIIGNIALNGMTGALIWDGATTPGATPGGSRGVGHNAFLGPTSTIADLDLDGVPEVIAGNTVYDGPTGAEEWTYTYTTSASTCQGAEPCDGFNAVGNFDDDPEGEVVIVRLGEVFVLNHDGTLLHQATIPKDDCTRNESGPPTVADFDGDGRPEIGTAGADFYVVIDFDCVGPGDPAGCTNANVLWQVPNQDCSSRATGSSVFDFEGDGAAEVVYADETTFRIFDGRDGTILYEDTSHSSNTRMEMPIVVDVDNDGKSEVIVPEPNTSSVLLGGIEIWEDVDNNWVRTRRIWNQHTYHVTNVTEDGQIPRREEPNWSNSRLNNFRQNVQPGGLFDAADLVVVSVALDRCVGTTANIAVTVGNRGALGAAPGVPVVAYADLDGSGEQLIGVERTTRLLLPGQEETLIFMYSPTGGFPASTFGVRAVVDDDGMGGSTYNECNEDNNEGLATEPLMSCIFG